MIRLLGKVTMVRSHLEEACSLWHFLTASPSFRASFWEHQRRWVLYTGYVYKHGCGAALKVSGDGHLEGARSLWHFSMQICLISCHFLETLAEMGPIHWVGVQTWLRSSHEGKWQWPSRGGSFDVTLFLRHLPYFTLVFGNSDRYWSYTLGMCTNMAAEHSWR